jgi:hypothetical protein
MEHCEIVNDWQMRQRTTTANSKLAIAAGFAQIWKFIFLL